MAFVVSKAAETSISDSEKENLNGSVETDSNTITTQLCLRSSSTHSSAEALDKEVVLKRIRHYKCLNKVKSTFQALVGSSGQPNSVLVHEQQWLDCDDAFSSP